MIFRSTCALLPEQDREYTVAKIYALGIPARLAEARRRDNTGRLVRISRNQKFARRGEGEEYRAGNAGTAAGDRGGAGGTMSIPTLRVSAYTAK